MGQVLDHIVKKQVDPSISISTDYFSEEFEIDRIEGGFSILVELSNGNGVVNMTFSLQFSNDNVNYSDVTDSEVIFTDDDGTILFDTLDTNTLYTRLKIQVSGGSIDLDRITLTGQRRH